MEAQVDTDPDGCAMRFDRDGCFIREDVIADAVVHRLRPAVLRRDPRP